MDARAGARKMETPTCACAITSHRFLLTAAMNSAQWLKCGDSNLQLSNPQTATESTSPRLKTRCNREGTFMHWLRMYGHAFTHTHTQSLLAL